MPKQKPGKDRWYHGEKMREALKHAKAHRRKRKLPKARNTTVMSSRRGRR